jgi:predicted dehydrogenase
VIRMKRREFFKHAIQRTALASTAASSVKRILGANERVVVGLIGCGGRGLAVAKLMREVPGVEFGAVCDVYETNARAAREWAGQSAKALKDFRRVLDQKEIDAVLIATPDHWHAIPAVLACQSGEAGCVDKPLGHTMGGGRARGAAAGRS